METAQPVKDFTCLTHDKSDDFQSALKTLKGRVVPKVLVKRVPYLVCTCKKKHTALDDIAESWSDIRALIVKSSVKPAHKNKHKQSESDETDSSQQTVSNIVGRSEEESQTPTCAASTSDKYTERKTSKGGSADDNNENTLTCDSSDENEETTAKCDSTDVNKEKTAPTCSNMDKLEETCLGSLVEQNKPLHDMFSASGLSVSEGRLMVVCYLCLRGNTEPLEPRALQKQKVEDLRKVRGRRPYFKHVKRLTKRAYPYTETVLINEPSITVATYVGKQGRNIKTINQDTDCRVEVNRGSTLHEIQVTIHAKSAADSQTLRQRVYLVKTYLKQQQQDWDRRQAERAKILRLRRQELAEAAKKHIGGPQWDIDVEQKESARDEYSKKSSYHNHHAPRGRPGRCNSGEAPSKRKVLDEASRCLNCLLTHTNNTEEDRCRYHPGFTKKDIWTCCNRRVRSKVLGSSTKPHHNISVEDQKDSHSYNGCKFGLHNWRRTKACVTSVKKNVQKKR